MVEFAFAVPVLVIMLFSIIEFGRAFNAQLTISHAAREAAREMSLTGNTNSAETVARDASANLDQSKLSVTPGSCTPGQPVDYKIDFTFDLNVPLLPLPGQINLSSTGVMRCE